MTPKSYPADSTYFVRVAVRGPCDPAADSVEMALLREVTRPRTADWRPAAWESENGRLWARLLVGSPSPLTLEKSQWHIWLRVSSRGSKFVRNAGVIDVT